jgi:alanyl-tRNA synthetase
MISTSDIRERFLAFFAGKGHTVVASSSLVPGNDKTLLFTNAGMVQFKELFTGDEVREYQRAVTSQRCVRAGGKHNDLDNVGYTARHHTFFEMLGNFSFGDYFKHEAIGFAWQFLTEELQLPAEKLLVTVFEEDDEAAAIWINEIGVPAERVIRIGAEDNFWMMGDTGPCGPCSEIFYDHGPDVAGGPPGSADEDGDRFIEIWNLVFMQFDRAADGSMTPLPKPCVDTGMGLERTAAILQHVHNNYEIDLFQSLIRAAAELTGSANLDNPSLKVIADHIRSCAFLILDGVLPGNEGRGYVLRRIIRRAARHGHKLGASDAFFYQLVEPLAAAMGDAYPELVDAKVRIAEQLLKEEERFAATLSAGLKILDEEVAALSGTQIPGEIVFRLYDTYGFPVDLTADIARERNLGIDQAGFETHMEAQRQRARAASSFSVAEANQVRSEVSSRFLGYTDSVSDAQVLEIYVDGQPVDTIGAGQNAWVVLDQTPFYGESGGQVGDSGSLRTESADFQVLDTQKNRAAFMHAGRLINGQLSVGDKLRAQIDEPRRQRIRQHHSATHLLHGALRHVLGTHVQQKGSLVNQHHLRFDFSHTGPISVEELADVERWIEREVRANSPCETREMSMDEAVAEGAMALFGEKYGSRVRVVKLGEQSVELCGGTHVSATGELGAVKLVTESGVAAGIRRVEAVCGEQALEHIQATERQLASVAELLKTSTADVVSRLQQLQTRNRELAQQLDTMQARLSSQTGQELASAAESVAGVQMLARVIDNTDAKGLRSIIDQLRQQLSDSVIVLASEHQGKAVLIASVSPALHQQIKAGELVKVVAQVLGGRGGGRADMAQGGAESLQAIDSAFAAARSWVAGQVSG